MATTILNQLKKTLEDEGEKKEFMKLYQQLCSQVDYNACAHMDTIVQKINQEAHQKIHRIVEEKIRPKEQQIQKLKRENGIARMVIQTQQDEIKRLEEENKKLRQLMFFYQVIVLLLFYIYHEKEYILYFQHNIYDFSLDILICN